MKREANYERMRMRIITILIEEVHHVRKCELVQVSLPACNKFSSSLRFSSDLTFLSAALRSETALPNIGTKETSPYPD